jgi:hypothetical protein
MLVREGDESVNAEGNKSCLMTIDTRASVMIARPDITAGLPERELAGPYNLQMTCGGTFYLLKEALIKFALGWCSLTT